MMYTTNYRRYKRRQRQIRRRVILSLSVVLFLAVTSTGLIARSCFQKTTGDPSPITTSESSSEASLQSAGLNLSSYPDELVELLDRNSETIDFVKEYPNRESHMSESIDLSSEYAKGTVPLLMQWDTRWGYNYYGDEIIALSGCGPTCLSMAYIYFTGDASMNPRKMSQYVNELGYCSSEGTLWSLWTSGVNGLGLNGEKLSLNKHSMERVLDNDNLIICSMSPGNFTTTGHIILIRGYDDNGFFVNDPNRKENSNRQWTYDTISSQIKALWVLSR